MNKVYYFNTETIRRRTQNLQSHNYCSSSRREIMEGLTEEEKRALRGSKFAPLPSAPSSSRSKPPRLAHPGGPLKTNKAAALAKFLQRKLQDPIGLASIDSQLLELAVKNAKETVRGGTSRSGRFVQHVNSFGDSKESLEEKIDSVPQKHTKKKRKKNKNKNKNKKHKILEDS